MEQVLACKKNKNPEINGYRTDSSLQCCSQEGAVGSDHLLQLMQICAVKQTKLKTSNMHFWGFSFPKMHLQSQSTPASRALTDPPPADE